jgi:phage terminase large subunit GpA-like protein
MKSLADLQTEREKIRAFEAQESYNKALDGTCTRDMLIGSALQTRAMMMASIDDMLPRLLEAIDKEQDETRVHYLMTDALIDIMHQLAHEVDEAQLPLPTFTEYFKRGAKPRDLLTVSQWADRNRWLQSGTNSPGRWNTALTPYLKEIMDSLSEHSAVRDVTFIKSSGLGGPLALRTPIATTKGWTTMGEISTQDIVFDELGQPCNVISVSEIFEGRQCYDITFSDGEIITSDDQHRWTVEDKFPGHHGKKHGINRKSKTITTQEIFETFKNNNRARYSIPTTKPLSLPEAELLIHPYVLGYWIANGNKSANQMTAHEDDAHEIANHISATGQIAVARKMPWDKGKAANIILEKQKNKEGECLRGHVLKNVGTFLNGTTISCCECHRQHAMKNKYGKAMDAVVRPHGFLTNIKALGIEKEKQIPAAYLRASIEQRFELIQGLMDGDGSITTDGRCEFSSVSMVLANQVLELLYSLGLKPSIYQVPRKAFSKSNKKLEGFHYRVSFTAYSDTPVFKLKRKLQRQISKENGIPEIVENRKIIDVKPVQSVKVRCIGVNSPSHLYLAGKNMIATHNTEALYNWLGYVMHHLQNKDMLVVVPTLELRDRSFNPRLSKMIDETSVLSELVSNASRNKANRGDLMEYGARARIIKAGANSPDSLRSDHLPYVICDEVDAFPWDVGGEGDPMTLIENRQRTFSRGKSYFVSTPTNDQSSRIEVLYKRSDMRRYYVPCPHCGEYQTLKLGGKDTEYGLKWKLSVAQENMPAQVLSVQYLCEHCKVFIDEGHKPNMLANGRWIAERPNIKAHRGYHLNALYAPIGLGLGWKAIVEKWLTSQNDTSELKAFVNTYLGEVWTEQGDSVDPTSLLSRLEVYPAKFKGLARTAGVDVQKDRLEVTIDDWMVGEECFRQAHIIIPGDTAQMHVWQMLDDIFNEWSPDAAAVDSGYNTSMVYAFVSSKPWCFAVKGMAGPFKPIVEDAKARAQRLRRQRKKGVMVHIVGVDQAKTLLFARLKITTPGPGYIHFPQNGDFDDEYFAQLTSEKLVTRVRGTRPIQEWVQTRSRNEALDCNNYSLAALRLANIDLAARAEKLTQPTREKQSPKRKTNNFIEGWK